jgi:hypothetical protein
MRRVHVERLEPAARADDEEPSSLLPGASASTGPENAAKRARTRSFVE